MECYTHGRDFRNFYWEGNQGPKILSSFSYITCCLTMINNLWSDVNDISSPRQGQVDQALIQSFFFFMAIPTCSNTLFLDTLLLSHFLTHWKGLMCGVNELTLHRCFNQSVVGILQSVACHCHRGNPLCNLRFL